MATGDSRPKGSEAYHHGDLRRTLLGAALAVIEEKGPDSISLAALARDAGVSQAAPYRHFADRDALLAEVATEGFRMFRKALVESMAVGSDRALLAICNAYVSFGLAHPGLYRLMFASPLLARADSDGDLKAVAHDSFELLVTALPDSVESGRRGIRALRVWAALHGSVMLASQGLLAGGPVSVEPEQLVQEIIS